ncbi:hypothetical protein Acr_05g0011330 [Actinidia rufa]|uniref:Retrovirus-related Pol polyprotein from transposon TNT 1-94-like beta-barrel domain-containing protein n=1 Tax=Actinidia rufa TaxID=165716 RepID=A0A7J0ELZ0_9ERIC|nr:hypothetical protein Acr_05g0011330 [Actinidia rufa]
MAENNLGAMIMLSATNYALWKPRMEDILFCKDLHDPLENKGDKPTEKKDKEWTKMNRKSIGLIRQCIGHEAKTSRNKALLMRRLVNLKLQRGTVAEHTSEFQNLVNQLASIDLYFDDEMQALLLLSSLPESWETLVVSLSNSAQDGKLTMSTVKDALFNEEARKKEMGMTDGSRERGREGHIKRNCPKYKTHMQSSETASASMMTDSDNDAFLVSSADENPDWVLDSGSAYHFCRDRKMFSTYATCKGLLRMAKNTTNKAVGKGTVRFRMADGRSVTLTEVRHVPKLRKNLISIEMLDSMGCSIVAKGGILRISKGNKEMLRGRKTRGLYRLEGSVQTGRAAVRHGSSDIRRKNGQGKQQVHTQARRDTWRSQSGTRAQGDALKYVRKFDRTRPVQDIHRKAQRKETKSILKSCTSTGALSSKRVSFALDLISGSDLSRCVHKGGEREPRRLAK